MLVLLKLRILKKVKKNIFIWKNKYICQENVIVPLTAVNDMVYCNFENPAIEAYKLAQIFYFRMVQIE